MSVKKTWELLRDIRPGDVYEIATNTKQIVMLSPLEGCGDYALVWAKEGGGRAVVALTGYVMDYEWRKRPQLVDFATAFAAYEAGKRIESESTHYTFAKSAGMTNVFAEWQVRGKWTILDEGVGAN